MGWRDGDTVQVISLSSVYVCLFPGGGGEEGGDDENKNEVSAKTAAVTSLYYAHDKGNVNEVMGGQ